MYLSWYTRFVALATFLLLIAGALVTSTGSGLAVPDWPLAYGRFFPPMIGGILYEHGHRMIATCVGFLALVQAVWFVFKEPRKWVRYVAISALGIVVLQGLLGGLTVILLLPDAVSISHAGLAEIFFCLTLGLAIFTSRSWWSEIKLSNPSGAQMKNYLPTLAAFTTGVIYFQILLGAYFRHSGSGFWMHGAGAIAVIFAVVRLVKEIFKNHSQEKRFLRLALMLLTFLVLQLMLGAGSYVSKLMTQDLVQPHPLKVISTSVHLAFGALMLAASLVLTLLSYRKFGFKKKWNLLVSAQGSSS